MSWLYFFQLWVIVGIFAGLIRPRMIWKEKNKSYRLALLLACAPAGIAFSILSGSLVALVGWVRGQMLSYQGVDPGKPDLKEMSK